MKYLIVFILVLIPSAIISAAESTPIVGIPGIDPANSNFNTYMNTLYALSIMAAAMLAVIKIIIAGVKWMTTDIITSKGEAKKDIQNSLLGLLIVLAAVLIISVINDKILDVNLNLNALPAPVNSVQTVNNANGTGVNNVTAPGTVVNNSNPTYVFALNIQGCINLGGKVLGNYCQDIPVSQTTCTAMQGSWYPVNNTCANVYIK